MYLLDTLAVFLPVLGAQDPAPVPAQPPASPTHQEAPAPATPHPAGRAFDMARLLPRDTLVTALVNPLGDHREALQATALAKFAAGQEGLERFSAMVHGMLANGASVTGIPTGDLERALTGGMALAWTGMDEQGRAQWVWIVDLGDSRDAVAAALPEMFTRLDEAGHGLHQEEWEDLVIHNLRTTDDQRISVTVREELLVAAHDAAAVKETVGRLTGSVAEPDLRSNVAFQEFVAHTTEAGEPVLGLFAQPFGIVGEVAGLIPEGARSTYRRIVDGARLQQIQGAGYALHARDGMLEDTVRLQFPEPRDGLLASLLAPPPGDVKGAAALLPTDTVAFTVTQVAWARIAHDVFEILDNVTRNAREEFDTWERGIERATGVHLRNDLLHNLGNRIVVATLPSEEGPAHGVVIRLNDSAAFARGIEKLRVMAPVPVTKAGIGGTPSWHLGLEADGAGVAVHGHHLVLASDGRTLATMLEQVKTKEPHQRAAAFLDTLPESTVSATWADLDRLAPALLRQLQDTLGLEVRLPEGTTLGELTGTSVVDLEGITWHNRSAIGNVHGLLGLAVAGARDVQGPGLAFQEQVGDLAEQTGHLDHGARMAAIAAAQEEFRTAARLDTDGDGRGEYGTFDELLAAGMLTETALGHGAGDGTWQHEGHLMTVLLPELTDEREEHYLAVCWPANSATGNVYAATPGNPAMANDILAAVKGIEQIDVRDVYVGRAWGGMLTEGWQSLQGSLPRNGNDPADQARIAAERARLQQLEALGKGADPLDLIELLDSVDPTVAARTAWLLGERKAAAAVPELVDLALETDHTAARIQALAALRRMPDPRALEACIHCLDDEDPRVRTLAAATLGRLRVPAAIDPLVDMLDQPAREDDETARREALLALHDIGQPRCLLPAATAQSGGSTPPELEQALAYLFQDLSPKLDEKEEVTTLLAVLDHDSTMLRRYAIQRLGEIGDPSAERALEGRLAVEDAELQGAIQASLTALRGPGASKDPVQEVRIWAETTWKNARQRWAKLSEQQRMVVMACGGVVGLGLLFLLFLRARRKRRLRATTVAAMVAPSASHGSGAYAPGPGEEEWAEEEYQEQGSGWSYDR